eukprot:COSAG02_NODE_40486_length_405_cov_0.617647_2_plen_46_part_01
MFGVLRNSAHNTAPAGLLRLPAIAVAVAITAVVRPSGVYAPRRTRC